MYNLKIHPEDFQFIVEAIKDLLGDEGFLTLLRAEGLETMPRALAMRIAGETDD